MDPAADQPRPPVTPHAAPIRDAEGRLTYIGDDGVRYIVGQPPGSEEPPFPTAMD